MTRINIGIVGTGGMGKIHTSSYMNNENTWVSGVCSITRDLAQSFADGEWGTVQYSEDKMIPRARYKIDKVYDNYQAMAEDPDIDAVSIVTPNNLHYEIAMAMLHHGKHILIEKPIAVRTAQAAEMVSLARQKGVILATGHMWRFHKDVQYIKKIIAEGILGDIIQTKSYGLHLHWGPDGWFSRKATAGGGALIDMGIHAIDTTRYLLGEPPAKSVYAEVGTRFREIDVDDFAQIMVKFNNGVVSLFESGWNYPFISGLEASTEIWGTKGYARIFPTFLSVKIGDKWGKFTVEELEDHASIETYKRQIDSFVDAILGRSDCLTAFEVGLETLKIVEAAYASAANDEVIRF